MPRGNRQMIVNRSSGGTFENITLKSTLLGIAVPFLSVAIMRLLLVGLGSIIALMIGSYAGGILSFGIGLYCFINAWRHAPIAHPWFVFSAFVASFVLILVSVFGYWPSFIVGWYWINGQMQVSFWGSELQPVTPWIIGLRIFLIFAVPLAVWTPWQWTEWALSMEMRWPKLREVPFSRADPGSVEGSNIKAMRTTPEAEIAGGEVTMIPAPIIEGE